MNLRFQTFAKGCVATAVLLVTGAHAQSSISLSCTSSQGGTCTASGALLGAAVPSYYWKAINVSMTILNGNSVSVTCQRSGAGFVSASTYIDGNTGTPLLDSTVMIMCP